MIENIVNKINEYSFTPKVIFDVGSRDLDESIAFKNKYSEAQIYAFEPNPEQLLICQSKAKEHNINFFNVAVSNIAGEHDYYAIQKDGPNPNIGASSLSYFSEEQLAYWNESSPNSKCQTKKYTISTTTLDLFCEENKINEIDVLWLDVKGWEGRVLKGAEKILENTRLIHAELSFKKFYESTDLYPKVEKFLKNKNFEEIYTTHQYIPDYENFRFKMEIGLTDSIFVNKKFI